MCYSLLKKLLFLRDPEAAHEAALRLLENFQESPIGAALLRGMAGRIAMQPVCAMGLEFQHPLGMAAGFDKDARCALALQDLGFAFVEVGTVTPRPQPGNPQPRLWRFPEAEALVNALGFPGEGMHAVRARLLSLRESARLTIPVGINLGKNKSTPIAAAVADYLSVLEHLHDVGDFFVINISSPNTPGLRDLQAVESLRPLLSALQERNHVHGYKPLLVKIAPDLADDDAAAVGRLSRELGLAGVVAGNTTIRRDLVLRAAHLNCGGLSGASLFARTAVLLKILRGELAADQTLIAAGGISSAERLTQVLALGANLAEVYTAFIYRGPRCAKLLTQRP
jgi:dihydroorotate dehydrogenase